jgi:hypothetical protein
LSTSNLVPQQVRRRIITPRLLLGAVAALSACASVGVNSAWQEGAPHGQPFSRVLVVGVTPNYNNRCNFEFAFASRIKSAATQALSSCDSMKAGDPLTPENIKRVVAATHADAVFATTLVASKYAVSEHATWDSRGGQLYKPIDYDYGVYGMPVVYAQFENTPSVTTYKASVHILTKVFETQNATLIYTLDTKTKGQDIESTEITILNIAGPTADRLRRDGLIH